MFATIAWQLGASAQRKLAPPSFNILAGGQYDSPPWGTVNLEGYITPLPSVTIGLTNQGISYSVRKTTDWFTNLGTANYVGFKQNDIADVNIGGFEGIANITGLLESSEQNTVNTTDSFVYNGFKQDTTGSVIGGFDGASKITGLMESKEQSVIGTTDSFTYNGFKPGSFVIDTVTIPVVPWVGIPFDGNSVLQLSATSGAITELNSLPVTLNTCTPAQLNGVNTIYSNSGGTGLQIPFTAAASIGTGDFTFEGWFYTTSTAYQYICDFGVNQMVLVFTPSSNVISLYDSGYIISGAFGTIPVNQWMHLAVVRSNGLITLYLNGNSIASGNHNTAFGSTTFTFFGYGGGGYNFYGYAKDVRISNIARYSTTFMPTL